MTFKKVGVTIIVLTSLCLVAFNDTIQSKESHWVSDSSGMEIYEPIVVLELFTSQGCSSCPSADLLLGKVKKEFQEEVYALSYHVDYWNYIGWKDPFSKSDYSVKQRKYNKKFKNRSNYTPQLVINGKEHFVGSNKAKMLAGIDKYKKKKVENHIDLMNVRVDNNTIIFNYEVKGSPTDKIVRVLLALDERTTSVKRGENRNRTLKNTNIVVSENIKTVDSANKPIAHGCGKKGD